MGWSYTAFVKVTPLLFNSLLKESAVAISLPAAYVIIPASLGIGKTEVRDMKHRLVAGLVTAGLVMLVNLPIRDRSAVYAQQQTTANAGFTDAELQQFAALNPIDTHTHIYTDDPLYGSMLEKLHLHTIDIADVDDRGLPARRDLAKENEIILGLVHKSSGHVFACTTFDPYRVSDPDFQKDAIRTLNASFAEGAIAVKEWKNVGMEVKNAKGAYILPDDPALEPIYRDIAAHHRTLITHIADLSSAWMPPDPNASDQSYYRQHPEWFMYNFAGAPSKQQILDARNHILAANPNLKMVGAHFGSMETDFKQLAATLDKYPNFAVDVASRLNFLQRLPKDEAIAFVTKYQDRLIYGTDNTIYPDENMEHSVQGEEAGYARDWRYLATDKVSSSRGREVQGLGLPESVLRKIYHDNAVRWFPGMKM